jgi:hypothetical protein
MQRGPSIASSCSEATDRIPRVQRNCPSAVSSEHAKGSLLVAKVRFRDAPHPLRECFGLLAAAWVAGFVLVPLTQGVALRVAMFTMGVAAALVGVLLTTNFKGAAEFYSTVSKRKSRLGIDYSNYVLLEPRFIRIGGILFVLVGLFFAVGAVTGPM